MEKRIEHYSITIHVNLKKYVPLKKHRFKIKSKVH